MPATGSVSLKQKIYNQLKERIMFCELLPGSLLSESELSESFDVSRTPVREALLELEKEGYVVIEPRKSTYVSKVSLRELQYVNEARIWLETHVIQTLRMPLSEELLLEVKLFRERLLGLLPAGDAAPGGTVGKYKFYISLDCDFHRLITSLAENPFILRFSQDLLQRSARQWYLMYLTIEHRLSVANEQHIAILDALIEGDAHTAASRLEAHISAFQNLQYFE